MRRFAVAMTVLVSVLLCGCRVESDTMQTVLDFRTELANAGGCSFTAAVEADYGDRVYSFTLDCRYDGKDGYLTVVEPAELCDISAKVDGSSSELSFDGAVLEYGPLANGYVAPLSVPWLLPSAWKGDYISSAGQTDEGVLATYLKGYHDEELVLRTLFSQGVPICAEVDSGGRRVLLIQITNFALK